MTDEIPKKVRKVFRVLQYCTMASIMFLICAGVLGTALLLIEQPSDVPHTRDVIERNFQKDFVQYNISYLGIPLCEDENKSCILAQTGLKPKSPLLDYLLQALPTLGCVAAAFVAALWYLGTLYPALLPQQPPEPSEP